MDTINDILNFAQVNLQDLQLNNDVVMGALLFLVALFMFLIWHHVRKRHKILTHAIKPDTNIIGADTTTYLKNEIATLKQKQQQIDTEMAYLEKKVKSIFRTAIVRYNPFKDSGTGGLQSFSTALIDENGTGLILTHLFSREMSRVQVKNINAWQADQELSPEEKQVLAQVKSGTSQ